MTCAAGGATQAFSDGLDEPPPDEDDEPAPSLEDDDDLGASFDGGDDFGADVSLDVAAPSPLDSLDEALASAFGVALAPLDADEDARESVTYQPLPLNTMPTG
ncbi:MAG: hypothetical protein NVSMB2_05900 [Chloroflexota bacterium]